jgi:hypothetical protein
MLEGHHWHQLNSSRWVPHWDDSNTCNSVFRLSASDLPAFAWFGPFVEGLCDDHALNNPFKDTQLVDMADTVITKASDEHHDESGEYTGVVVSTDTARDFICHMRFVCSHLGIVLCTY